MWVRVLGSAAGGGSPQWNCGCSVCAAVRTGAAPRRTQSSVILSLDRRRWFLFNASPDVLTQLDGLSPAAGRRTPFEAILLTDGELDHTLGLLMLREAPGLRLHATAAVHKTLKDGSGLLPVLQRYCQVDWVPVVPGEPIALAEGLSCRAFDVRTTKSDRFGLDLGPGRVVGYRISDASATLVYLPGMQRLTAEVLAWIEGCDCLLIDGTCWSDDEMVRLGLSAKTARQMGHQPVAEILEQLAAVARRTVFVHLNNTNPMLLETSPERRVVVDSGLEIAEDGMEIEVVRS